MNCAGKVALVTGAAGNGLGRSIALTLAREGARVVVNYRSNAENAHRITRYIESCGGSALAVEADVFDDAACTRLVDAVIERFGRVDICVVGPGGGWHPEPIERLNVESALEDLNHEVGPTLRLLARVLPGMYERRWGRCIGIATHPVKLSPAYAYNLGKAARQQAFLLAQDPAWEHQVTMNIIAPGPVSGLVDFEKAVEQAQHGPAWQNRADVSPQDIAEGVAFLCSEAGQYISGCVLPYLFR